MHIIQSMTVLLCERPIAVSSHVPIIFPQGHVSSVRELVIIPHNFLQQLCSVHTHCVHSVSVYGPVQLFLIDLMEGKVNAR